MTTLEPEQHPRRLGRRVGMAGALAVAVLAVGGGAYALSSVGADNVSGTGTYRGYGGYGAAPQRTCTSTGTDADGYVTSATSSSLAVKDLFGTAHTYQVTSATKVRSVSDTGIAITDVATGAHVHVTASGTGSNAKATEVDVLAAGVAGSVTAVSGSTITVRDMDGFTRTVTTSSGTTYTKDGSSATASAVTSGAVVFARGTVDSDGTTLDATAVDVRTAAGRGPIGGPAGPRGHVGPGGCGGPGRPPGAPGERGPRPGGTPPAVPATPASPSPSTTS